jgi:hypothetical protein
VTLARTRTSTTSFSTTVALVVLASALAACGGGGSPAVSPMRTTGDRPEPATPVTVTASNDGSLGDADAALACTLLDAAEIEAQFGGPVGAPTPIYPYCQWIVADGDAFVALTILRMPMDEARNVYTVRTDVEGVGDDAYISSSRALVFGVGDTSYSLLWQQVGDFTTVETDRLVALAQRVLTRAA